MDKFSPSFFVADLSYVRECEFFRRKCATACTVAALRNLSGGRIVSRRFSIAYLLNLTPFEYLMLGSVTESVPGGRAF
jgi:hypothetical protein